MSESAQKPTLLPRSVGDFFMRRLMEAAGFALAAVGGLLAAGPAEMDFSKVMGFCAVTLASVNIFGGFIVTQRMLAMFKKKS